MTTREQESQPDVQTTDCMCMQYYIATFNIVHTYNHCTQQCHPRTTGCSHLQYDLNQRDVHKSSATPKPTKRIVFIFDFASIDLVEDLHLHHVGFSLCKAACWPDKDAMVWCRTICTGRGSKHDRRSVKVHCQGCADVCQRQQHTCMKMKVLNTTELAFLRAAAVSRTYWSVPRSYKAWNSL